MNEVIRKSLENVVQDAETQVADKAEFSAWGTAARAHASFAIALLQLDATERVARALEKKRRGVVQEEAPPPVEKMAAASAVDAGSSPAPAAKPVRKRRRRGTNRK